MKNNFSEEEIRNSIEYRWRVFNLCFLLICIIVCTVLECSISFMSGIDFSSDIGKTYVLVSVLSYIVFFIFMGSMASYFAYKARYLLKHYEEFESYCVEFDEKGYTFDFGRIYFMISINDIKGKTNALFNNSLFSSHYYKNFINKKVNVLYDRRKRRFYVIELVD